MHKTMLVIEKGVKLNGEAYKKLEAAGYVVIRGNPSDFHVVGQDLGTTTERLLGEVARTTIATTVWGEVRREFGQNVIKALERSLARTPRPAPTEKQS